MENIELAPLIRRLYIATRVWERVAKRLDLGLLGPKIPVAFLFPPRVKFVDVFVLHR